MPLPIRSEQDILPFALDTARRFGDPNPTLIQHVPTTLEGAGAVFGSRGHDEAPAYLVAIKGQFSVVKPTRGASAHRTIITKPVLFHVVDATTGQVVISGSRDSYPDLASVGPLVTDLDSSGPACN